MSNIKVKPPAGFEETDFKTTDYISPAALAPNALNPQRLQRIELLTMELLDVIMEAEARNGMEGRRVNWERRQMAQDRQEVAIQAKVEKYQEIKHPIILGVAASLALAGGVAGGTTGVVLTAAEKAIQAGDNYINSLDAAHHERHKFAGERYGESASENRTYGDEAKQEMKERMINAREKVDYLRQQLIQAIYSSSH